MKRKIIGIFLCMLLVIPALSMTAIADPDAKLKIKILGGFPLLGMQNIGGTIVNTGDATAHDVAFNYTVTGGFSDSIEYTLVSSFGDLAPNEGIVIITDVVYGFGPVTITLSVSSSNADNITETAKGFQIGSFAWIPLSLSWLWFVLLLLGG